MALPPPRRLVSSRPRKLSSPSHVPAYSQTVLLLLSVPLLCIISACYTLKMPPKPVPSVSEVEKKKKKVISIELKKEIIRKFEEGARVIALQKEFSLAKSTVTTILKNKDKIKEANVAKGVVLLHPNRPKAVDEVEKMLLLWLGEKQRKGDSVSEEMICERARQLYTNITKDEPSTSTEQDFSFSKGWFTRFRKRSGIHNVRRHGEAASADKEAAEKFTKDFEKFVEKEGYLPEQVFNSDETGLFWKRMPNRTYLTEEEKALPGHKAMKDRLTLMLCSNASGDCKIKPLLVYHSENPRAFKKGNINKRRLQVWWTSNPKAWATRMNVAEWLAECCGPQIRTYLIEKGLPLKCLLLLDNAPAHPVGLADDLPESLSFIKVKFLPPNTTSLIQPMDQQVIAIFKKLYTKALFQKCFQVTSDTDLTLREFWRSHFNILHCVGLITNSWDAVSESTLRAAWRNVWPGMPAISSENDFIGFEPDGLSVVQEIVSVGEKLGLDVTSEDVEELVEEHGQELTNEELQELYKQQVTGTEEVEESIAEENAGTSVEDAKRLCREWQWMQDFIEMTHPDKTAAASLLHQFNTVLIPHYRKLLQRRQKQVKMDRYLVPTPAKRPREEEDPQSSTELL